MGRGGGGVIIISSPRYFLTVRNFIRGVRVGVWAGMVMVMLRLMGGVMGAGYLKALMALFHITKMRNGPSILPQFWH